jgi:hypothetical protein
VGVHEVVDIHQATHTLDSMSDLPHFERNALAASA